MRYRLRQRWPVVVGLVVVPVALLIFGPGLTSGDFEDEHVLLQRADEALYVAKRTGKNRVPRWPGAQPA